MLFTVSVAFSSAKHIIPPLSRATSHEQSLSYLSYSPELKQKQWTAFFLKRNRVSRGQTGYQSPYTLESVNYRTISKIEHTSHLVTTAPIRSLAYPYPPSGFYSREKGRVTHRLTHSKQDDRCHWGSFRAGMQ